MKPDGGAQEFRGHDTKLGARLPAVRAYFAALQLQPPLHRQALLQAQLAPQVQRSTATPLQPQEAFSHRHSLLTWFSIVFSSLATRSVRADMEANAAPLIALHPPLARHRAWIHRFLRFQVEDDRTGDSVEVQP